MDRKASSQDGQVARSGRPASSPLAVSLASQEELVRLAGPSEVFVVDDDPSVPTALGRVIASAGHAVRTFGSGTEFWERFGQLGPGCLVLDVRVRDLDGLELYRQLQESGAVLPVIFLIGFRDIPTSVQVIKAGALHFLPKPVANDTLLRAIENALAEEALWRADRLETQELARRYSSLTARETEVMQLVLEGRLNKQIARDLRISEKTVKVHRGRAMAKMGARRVTQLVQFSVRLGIGAPSGTPVEAVKGEAVHPVVIPPEATG